MNINPANRIFSRISESVQKLNVKAGAVDLDAANNAIMMFKESDALAAGLGLTRLSNSNTGGPIVDLSKFQRDEQLRTIAQAA